MISVKLVNDIHISLTPLCSSSHGNFLFTFPWSSKLPSSSCFPMSTLRLMCALQHNSLTINCGTIAVAKHLRSVLYVVLYTVCTCQFAALTETSPSSVDNVGPSTLAGRPTPHVTLKPCWQIYYCLPILRNIWNSHWPSLLNMCLRTVLPICNT